MRLIYPENTDWSKCPICHSWMIEGASIDIDGMKARQELSCGACDASWTEVYQARFKSIIDIDIDHVLGCARDRLRDYLAFENAELEDTGGGITVLFHPLNAEGLRIGVTLEEDEAGGFLVVAYRSFNDAGWYVQHHVSLGSLASVVGALAVKLWQWFYEHDIGALADISETS